jgi:hypothetical protein
MLAMSYRIAHTTEARSLPGYRAEDKAGSNPATSGDIHA